MVNKKSGNRIHIEMGLSSDKKREIIDNVQVRINKWIGRSYMTIHEAILLNEKHYPFKIQIKSPAMGLIIRCFEQSKIQYSELYCLINETDVKTAEEKLFRHIINEYLSYCFGG